MASLRRALRRIAVTWLLCQASTLALAPTVLGFGLAEELLECTCAHGDHAVCPMHHEAAPGPKLCVMGGAGGDSTAAMTSLFGGTGLLPARQPAPAPDPEPAIALAEISARSLRPAPPDPPPPRL